MNKLPVISFFLVLALVIASCSDVRRERGREYMPDMAYSRAYETYAPHEELKERGVNYTAMPVPGTIKRGEEFPFSIPKDKAGDTTNYVASKQIKNPLPPLDSLQLKESERLYLVNCGICHGTALDGNGPLYNDGKGPYPAAPKNLIADAVVSVMPEGQIFYSVTYGKGVMGSYASQLSTSQRWRVIHYVKGKQLAAKSGSAPAAGGSTAAPGAMAAPAAGAQATGAPATGATKMDSSATKK
ncbi:MAG: cytochrome c [Chitinophagaceae bacterium]